MIKYEIEALEYLSKLSEGGMRDAITLLDKCLAYSTDLTLENVVKALGVVDYEQMISLTKAIVCDADSETIIGVIEKVHMNGKDLKQFIKSYTNFVLDLNKYNLLKSFEYLEIPAVYATEVKQLSSKVNECQQLLRTLIQLSTDIKWESNPKPIIEATLLLEVMNDGR